MNRSGRFGVHIYYADGSPGIALGLKVADATALAEGLTLGRVMHGGHRVACAQVFERLSNGALSGRRIFYTPDL